MSLGVHSYLQLVNKFAELSRDKNPDVRRASRRMLINTINACTEIFGIKNSMDVENVESVNNPCDDLKTEDKTPQEMLMEPQDDEDGEEVLPSPHLITKPHIEVSLNSVEMDTQREFFDNPSTT
jgi:hypothetical protein